MKVAALVVAWLGVASAFATGCGGGASKIETTSPVVILAPDDFVLRDVRKDAARYLNCQVPDIGATVGPWAGSEGNVTAHGCGFQVSYYLRCITSHQCSMTATD